MSDWLTALRSAPSPPSELLEFAATQPSLAATWQNATRGDWVIWMAANGFGTDNSPQDIVDATGSLADYAGRPWWRLALHFRASDYDVLRRFRTVLGDFDLDQLVAYVYLGLAVGGAVGLAAYWQLPGYSIPIRQLASSVVLVIVTVLVALLAYRTWKASVTRAATRTTLEAAVPMALALATRASLRSNVMKQVYSARMMRRRLDGPAME